jgi:hypothetical protein
LEPSAPSLRTLGTPDTDVVSHEDYDFGDDEEDGAKAGLTRGGMSAGRLRSMEMNRV